MNLTKLSSRIKLSFQGPLKEGAFPNLFHEDPITLIPKVTRILLKKYKAIFPMSLGVKILKENINKLNPAKGYRHQGIKGWFIQRI